MAGPLMTMGTLFKGCENLARFAISAEGAASMRALANQLLLEANAIYESSTTLEKTVVAENSGLGIYQEEIIALIQHGRNVLNASKDDTIALAKKIQSKAQEIEELFALNLEPGAGAATSAGITGGAGGSVNGAPSMTPTRSFPRNLAASQYTFVKDSDGTLVYDSPMETGKYLYTSQGSAYNNIRGTCGLCSCANVIRLSGVDVDEKKIVDHAMGKGLCSFDKNSPASSGGTDPSMRQRVLSDFGISSHLEKVKTTGGMATEETINSIADNVSKGRGVIVSVDAGHFYKKASIQGQGHAITVTSVKKSPQGEVLGFYVCDSNRGTRYIQKADLQRALRASQINVTDSVIR